MARPASIQLGGYFPTQTEVMPLILSRLSGERAKYRARDYTARYSIFDPCAGEGTAAEAVADHLFTNLHGFNYNNWIERTNISAEILMNEAEQSRYYKIHKRSHVKTTHADAFRLTWRLSEEYQGVSLLFLNPPYDIVDGQRLEKKFLDRFTPAVAPGGILVLIVPEYTLDALSETLTTRYERLSIYRYPAPVYDVFKQCVVYGVRRSIEAEPGELPATCPLEKDDGVLYELPTHCKHGLASLDVQAMDLQGILTHTKVWSMGDINAPSIFPMAMRPRPGSSSCVRARTYSCSARSGLARPLSRSR